MLSNPIPNPTPNPDQVRPKEWVMYNSGMGSAVDALTGSAPIDAAPGLRADLEQVGQQLKAEGCYPVRSPFDLMMTSVQTKMDANRTLTLPIEP